MVRTLRRRDARHLALEDDITLAVVEALKVTLFGEEKAAALRRYTEDAEAFELFLKGRYHFYRYTAQGGNGRSSSSRRRSRNSRLRVAYAAIAARAV